MRDRKTWKVSASSFAHNTFNPIRNLMENMVIEPNPDKAMIALSIGDPTVFGNLVPDETITDAVIEAVQSGKYNGYAPTTGLESARAAVAKYWSVEGKLELTSRDIMLCSSCSGALDLTITALCNPGQNIAVPRPGFPLYGTLAKGLSINTKDYDLKPDKNWEVDLASLEACIDEDTAAIVVNNPSNPCGAVYSKQHLLDILEVARRNKVPIIADEIYDYFVFEGHEFHPMATLTKEVPILACGGLTKRYLVPGWRFGWIAICDRGGVFEEEVRHGLHSLSQRILGANTIVQGALPSILENTPKQFFADTINELQKHADICYSALSAVPGLKPVMPQGAMYMMIGIEMSKFPAFKTDLEFVEKMISEESVFPLPGKVFNYPNYVRIVLTVPEKPLREACTRITAFCARYYNNAAIDGHVNGHLYFGVTNGASHGEEDGMGIYMDGVDKSGVEEIAREQREIYHNNHPHHHHHHHHHGVENVKERSMIDVGTMVSEIEVD